MADINIFNKLNDNKTSKYIELDSLCEASNKYGKQMGGAIVTNTNTQTCKSQLLTVYAATPGYANNGAKVDSNIRYCVLNQTGNGCRDSDICISFNDIEPLCEQLMNIKKEYEAAKTQFDELLKKVDPVEIKTYKEN